MKVVFVCVTSHRLCFRLTLTVTLDHPFDIVDFCSEQYNLEYYLDFTRKLTELGIHVLAIKDMAGLLKPPAATMLVRVHGFGEAVYVRHASHLRGV